MVFEEDILRRKESITNDENFRKFERSFDGLIEFMWSLSNLISWNGYLIAMFIEGEAFILGTELIDSSVNTLLSIKKCSRYGNIGDANALIRKYRDDIFLYLYFLEVTSSHASCDAEMAEHARNATKWTANELDDLHISKIFQFLANNKSVAEVIDKHHLKSIWDVIGANLNNYVHNNGIAYTLLNYRNFDEKGIKSFTRDIIFKVEYITVVFMIILILIYHPLISAPDYVDAITVGIEPEEDSQYFIAPFIQEFINDTVKKVNPNLKKFLIDNVYMYFDD